MVPKVLMHDINN